MATVLGSKRKEDKGKAVYSTAPLPLGFEFNPTDEQLIDHYLRLKNAGRESEVQIIGEVDFYDYEPWDLPELSVIKSDQLDWFFFCRRHAKEQSTSSIWTMVFSRPNRATAAGYWETTGDDCPIRSTKSSAFGLIGLKKTLVFYEGRAPNGTRTDWIMHEYRATEGDLAGTSPHQDDFVLCRLFERGQFYTIDGDTIYHTGLYTDPYTGPGLSLSTTNSSYAGPGLALSTTNSSYAGPGLCLSTTNSSYADPSNLSADPSDLTEEAVPQREDSSLDLCLNFSTQGILLRDAIAEAKCEGVVYEIEAESSLKAFAKQDLCLNSSTPSILLREAFAEEGIEKRITSESQGEVFEVEAVEMKSNSREKFGEIEAEIKFLQDMKFEIEEIGLEPETSEMDWKTFSMGLEIYSDPIIQREVLQSCLMWGGLGLTKPPKDEDWENAKMIYLMDNELSVLPKNPRCPLLSTLFLQRNYKLRTIPPSFFDYMPALQILNLSRTGIKSLPESILRLVSLKRLFLNDCHRFMILSPKVGELKRLEILDLEGTDIMDLPKEIKELTNLTCLEVSLYADLSNGRRAMQSAVVVPCGIISALSHLEELNINVNPDDKRWNACVEAIVTEVCTLESLNTLKFYFPRVENVRHFLLNSPMWVNPSLSHFRFTVGHHVTRIISRLPRDVEFELERWERCLKYINGVAVPREIKRVLQYSTAFFLERHATVKKLSDFGIGNMKQLKCCVVGECNEVEVIIYETDAYEENNEADAHEEDDEVDACEEDDSNEIVSKTSGAKKIVLGSLEYLCIYYMKNLRRIWEGPVQPKSLSLLKFLTLHTCPELTTVFTKDLLDNLYNLEELTIEDCPSIETLVSCEVCAEHKTSHFLPNLKRISLHYMPKLDTISSGLHIAPRLEWLSLYNCPNLKNPLIEELSSKDLKKIKGERSWWEALEWESGCPAYLDDIFVPINIWDC